MNTIHIKNYFLALASVFTLGVLGCNGNQDNGNSNNTSQPAPVKDIPAVVAPVANYEFYEPTSEEGLKNNTLYGYILVKTRPGFKATHFERLGLKVAGCLEANGASYYRLYKESDVLGALKSLKKISSVIFAEPEPMRRLCALDGAPISFGDNMDTYLKNRMQWSAHATKAYDAWTTYGFGPTKVVAASLDSGVQYNHEDLKSVVKHAYTWWNAAGTDYFEAVPDDLYSWNPRDAKAMYPDYWGTDFEAGLETDGHGTHTTGIICANGNNGVGMAGICWNVDFINYQISRSDGATSPWTIFGSVYSMAKWKKDNNYDYTIPMNCSLGGRYASQFEIDIIEYALQNGVLLIAASGNDSFRWHFYPAAYAGVMAVGASNPADKRASFSNYGPYLSVVAPGADIVSTIGTTKRHDTDTQDKNSYRVLSGTSMAAPHVTGLAAYLLTFNPELKPHEIRTYIERYADYIDGANGYTEETGWGRINVLNTVKAVIDDVNAGRTPVTNYAAAPVKIITPFSGLNVFLYSCNQAGTIQNYVASTISGYRFDEKGEAGAAYFNMLRPGRYIAHVPVSGLNTAASTEPFEVFAGQSDVMELEVVVHSKILTIQTFATQDIFDSNYSNVGDTVIGLYDSDGEEIVFLDEHLWDTVITAMPEPGDYYIHITDYSGDNNPGEYALWLTAGRPWTPASDRDWITDNITNYPVAPGSFTNPIGGVKSTQAQTTATAQTIGFNTIYYGRFNLSGGTSGATGHYYKFTVMPQE